MAKVFILLVLTFHYSKSYFNLYSKDIDSDCLYYFRESSPDIYIIPYCLQQSTSLPLNGEKFTFQELRQLSISSAQLYEWSAPIDIIESYQIYLSSDDINFIKHSEIFYNCSDLWFGTFCQYTFHSFHKIFTEIVKERSEGKTEFHLTDVVNITNGTCYTNFKCDYILLPPACLDWREICDGKFDCMNGEDEEQCSVLETNLCEDGFFRCKNGFCIPESLLYDLTASIDCIDSSDAFNPELSTKCPHESITFLCDESICEHQMMFACGDGQCISRSLYEQHSLSANCENGRNLIHSISMFQNQNNSLSDQCWNGIICAFQLQHIFNIDCSKACPLKYCESVIKKTCKSRFHFPSNPIISNSIHLMYDTGEKIEWTNNTTPTHICYNVKQCKSLFKGKNIALNDTVCQIYEDFNLKEKYEKWEDLLDDITNLFKACSLPGQEIVTNQFMDINYDDNHECSHSSLFHCKGSSKCISKYRINDGHSDCYNSSDEYYEQSCSLNLNHYHRCENQEKCVPVILYDRCSDHDTGYRPGGCEFMTWTFVCKSVLRSSPALSFGKLCDKFVDFEPDSHNETDETNCPHDWPCLTRYNKCDKYWHCKNGADELNCYFRHNRLCNTNEHYCQHVNNKEIDCIHIDDINDDQIQCLGALDDRTFCREKYPNEIQRRYKCLNSSLCIDVFDLCDCKNDCPFADDEYMVCPWLRKFPCIPTHYLCKNGHYYPRNYQCDGTVNCNDSNEDENYCHIIDIVDKPWGLQWFDPSYFAEFPPLLSHMTSSTDKKSVDEDLAEMDDNFDDSLQINTIKDPFLYWYCNRGILIHLVNTFKCLCPPAYYGDRCQYQNERISVTMLIRKQSALERHVVFKLVVLLLDNETNIISTEHITYLPLTQCQPRFNIYLLYDHQPRIFRNYSVRIDAYSQDILSHSIDYRASWYYRIPFNFLPVYKLVIDFLIPESRTENIDISEICEHGQWISYVNTNEYFCLCDPGWSGELCDISYDCQCSKNSLCIGHTALTKESICVCELEKIGTLCHIPISACQSNPCQNNGKCVSLDERSTDRYYCICPQEFSGDNCEHYSSEIIVQFIDIKIPNSMLIHLVIASFFQRIRYQTIFQRIPLKIENEVIVYIQKDNINANIIYAEINENYYLIYLYSYFLNTFNTKSISTHISQANRCPHVRELFSQDILGFHLLKRAKFYHRPCLQQHQLSCFYDENYMCLCDKERHVDCYDFPHNKTRDCNGINYCKNDALCFHDDLRCPRYSQCVCRECFYGIQCQFTTSVYSMTLDSIIGPYIIPNITLHEQPLIIKLSLSITLIIFTISLTDNTLSLITFFQKSIFSTSFGMYLLFSSITSIFTVIILLYKFIYFLHTQFSMMNDYIFAYINCVITDFFLKFLTSMNNWLHACVSIERVTCLILGIQFDNKRRKHIAIVVSLVILILNITTAIHELFSRQIINTEERIWCVATYHYKPWMNIYNKVIIIINLVGPFIINILSAIFIIKKIAHVKSRTTMERQTYRQHLTQQFQNQKHLIISSFMLVLLTLPRSIISFYSDCMKSEREASLFLVLYFLSFLPSTTTFIVFILPSKTYLNEFSSTLKRCKINIKHFLRAQN